MLTSESFHDRDACMLNGTPNDRAEIDNLVGRFFAAFTNKGDMVPNVESLAGLFIPAGIIVKAIGQEPEVYTVKSFIEPRARLISNGTLTDFHEEETAARTDILGNIAQRVSLYRKSGRMSGERLEGAGVKVIQLVRTGAGWRISSVAWDDERDGLTIPEAL